MVGGEEMSEKPCLQALSPLFHHSLHLQLKPCWGPLVGIVCRKTPEKVLVASGTGLVRINVKC